MTLPLYQVDAFAAALFEGNPAAVCPLDAWLPDALMQRIAEENNLSETAFFAPTAAGDFEIRWFTPTLEVDLCGHATLAAAHVLFREQDWRGDEIAFDSRSGPLRVTRRGELLSLDFPLQRPQPCELPEGIEHAFAAEPLACLKAEDYIVLFECEDDLLAAAPDLALLKQLDGRGVIITALPGEAGDYDFVVRFFAPKCGIDEDPVTGSAYAQLAPYWSERLGRRELRARQLSERGGEVRCAVDGERVRIAGRAVTYLRGEIRIEVEQTETEQRKVEQ